MVPAAETHRLIKPSSARSALGEEKLNVCINIQGTVFIIDSPVNDYVLCNDVELKANQASRDSS